MSVLAGCSPGRSNTLGTIIFRDTFLSHSSDTDRRQPSPQPAHGRLFSFFSPLRSFLFALGAALLFPALAQAATITVTGTAPNDWATLGTIITLTDGDVLTIGPLAGQPTNLTVIAIAADANVTINGNGLLIPNLRMIDNAGDLNPHDVYIKDLQISSDPSASTGYNQHKGVLHLSGANAITGGTWGIDALSDLSIESASGGTLTVDGNGASHSGILAPALHVLGSAQVTVTSAAYRAIELNAAPLTMLEVAAGATLDATSAGTYNGIYALNATTFDIVCNGVIQVHGSGDGIYAGNAATTITGSGTLNATGAGNDGIYAKSLSVTGTTVNVTGNTYGLEVTAASDVVLAGGATLNLTGGSGWPAFSGTGFTMAAGTTVTLTNGSAASESHPFTMAAGVPAGTAWQLTNTTPSGASTVTPLTVAVAAGQKGTIKLNLRATPLGSAAVPTLSPALLALLAALLGGLGLALERRRQ